MGGLKLGMGALVVVLAVGCGQSADHPANLTVDGGQTGGGGGGGPCDPKPGYGVTLSGNQIIYDIFFKEDPIPFLGKSLVKAEGEPCGYTTTTYDGSLATDDGGINRFELQSVHTSAKTWVRLYEDASSNEGVYSTLLLASANADQVLDNAFGFIRAADVDKVYTDTNTTPDPDRATIVVQLIDGLSKQPATGGKVGVSADAITAYPGATAWTLDAGGTGTTDPSGTAVLMNVKSSPFPGNSITVDVTMGSVVEPHSLVVESGAVTIAWILVGFQS